ncbi:MAG: hypothetical protein RMA76_45205 [Deltaproteobacteria bacterium]|jgi:hypothetical protein
MIVPVLTLALVGAAPADFFPCEKGHTIEYRLSNGATWTDVVRGPHPKRAVECVVDRAVVEKDDKKRSEAWVFERTKDRVSDAGWLDTMTAFRPPLLVAPLTAGKSWQFNRTRYTVEQADAKVTVKAGTFTGCVVVAERPVGLDRVISRSTYAPGFGLVRVERGDQVREAVRVSVAKP